MPLFDAESRHSWIPVFENRLPQRGSNGIVSFGTAMRGRCGWMIGLLEAGWNIQSLRQIPAQPHWRRVPLGDLIRPHPFPKQTAKSQSRDSPAQSEAPPGAANQLA